MTSQEPLVSVIVPTHNAESTLTQCLESVRNQTYPNIELLVVDNYSTDRTREIAAQRAESVISAGNERSAQVNAGVELSRGEYIYRVDADFVLQPTLVAEAVAACSAGHPAVLIHNRSDPSQGRWARVREFEREMYRGDSLNVAARFVRRDVFDFIGGFDEALIAGEDYDFHRRLTRAGHRAVWITAAELHIGEPRSLREVATKHFFYGRKLRRYIAKEGRFALRQLSPIRPALFTHRRVLISRPRLTAWLLIYLLVKYAAGTAGLLSEICLGYRRDTSNPKS